MTVGNRDYLYFSFLACLMSQHVRLFEMSSSGGWFVANEVLHTARSDSINPFLFLQDDLYTADQPGKLCYKQTTLSMDHHHAPPCILCTLPAYVM